MAVAAGYVNFELVYSGVTKDGLKVLYREHSPQDFIRAAFTQELAYERDASTIRYKAMLIRVLEATSQQVRFVVLEDGYREIR